MIDRILSKLHPIPLPSSIKEDLIAAIRQLPETGASVSQQNGALYRACGAIKSMLPDHYAEVLCRYLCDALTVGVSPQIVRQSIRRNRNKPIPVLPDYDPLEGVTIVAE